MLMMLLLGCSLVLGVIEPNDAHNNVSSVQQDTATASAAFTAVIISRCS